jgi:hypothetical protein
MPSRGGAEAGPQTSILPTWGHDHVMRMSEQVNGRTNVAPWVSSIGTFFLVLTVERPGRD